MGISEEFINFVSEHANDDALKLRLKYSGKQQSLNYDIDFAITQIEARKKTRRKLPSFIEHRDFLFPTLLSAEQASNEAVARYHATIIPTSDQRPSEPENQRKILDLTAGLGIDAMSNAMAGCDVTACEIDELKCDALRHNAQILGIGDSIRVNHGDSIEFLKDSNKHFDVIYADPARRAADGAKVHALADCQPDILSAMDTILQKTNLLIVKASPLLDLTLIRETVKDLKRIHVVCFRGECKEVLMEISKDHEYEGTTVVDLDWDHEISRFDFSDQRTKELEEFRPETQRAREPEIFECRPETQRAREPEIFECRPETQRAREPEKYKYLYEPNAGLMKTGAWDALTQRYPELVKADKDTHIFLSNALYSDFPGRIIEIEGELDKNGLKRLKGAHINVVARNYPMTAPQLEKKIGTKPGKEEYLYAFRWHGRPVIVKGIIKNQ